MIYVDNDFYSNYISAVKADDDAMIQRMFIDQISTSLAKRRGEIIQVLSKVGISTTKNPSNEELVNLIVSNIRNNKKLQAGLAYVIALQNDILKVSEEKSKNQKKKEEAEEGKEKVQKDDVSVVTQMSKTLYFLADSLEGDRANSFKLRLQKHTNDKAPNYSAQTSKKKSKGKVVKKKKKSRKKLYIFLGVVAVAGVAYYGYKKGWFSKIKKAEAGGDIGSGTVNPSSVEAVGEGVSQV